VWDHSGPSVSVPMESLCTTSDVWIIATKLISCTVSEIWRIFGPIFTVDRGCLSLRTRLGWNSIKRMVSTFGLEKVQTPLYRMMLSIFRYLYHLTVSHECDGRTERRTDFPLAIRPRFCTTQHHTATSTVSSVRHLYGSLITARQILLEPMNVLPDTVRISVPQIPARCAKI